MSTDPPADLVGALRELAYNLRWSWDSQTTQLFAAFDEPTWAVRHNPVAVLRVVEAYPKRLEVWRTPIREAHAALSSYLSRPPAFLSPPRVAYFSAEFAIAECLPIYSGGLGVLAGDHLKAASDLGIPLAAVGLFYRYGYFRQQIDSTGYQREQYERLDPEDLPLQLVRNDAGEPLQVSVPFPGRLVQARVWRAQVGRIPLYLLDTDLPGNREDDRWITGHLYGGDQDTRIRQEMVLGIGGARLLRALGERGAADVYHMNEGHSAFLSLELARQWIDEGRAADLNEAIEQLAPRIAFTTHTPVEAGHDAFPSDLVEAYFADYVQLLGLTHEQLMALGRRAPADTTERFTMTILALRSAARRNAVSQLHGVVSKEMWSDVGVGVRDVSPARDMDAVTNGVHTATWVGPEMSALYDEHLGTSWRMAPHLPLSWEKMDELDPQALWRARTAQRARLLERVDEVARAIGLGGLADEVTAERALVLGFARRFATYKRAGLLLAYPDRVARILAGDPTRPVVLLFAGKAHPRDEPGKALIQRIVQASREDPFRGRLVFLPDYDVALARLMVQGSDVWVNTPRRPMEASGTSGMKATLNGGLHLSELDGWWNEAFEEELGWALGTGVPEDAPADEQDEAEGQQLITILENEVCRQFFARDAQNQSPVWLERVRRSIQTLGPAFSAHRMVSDYVERVYVPAARAVPLAIPSTGLVASLDSAGGRVP